MRFRHAAVFGLLLLFFFLLPPAPTQTGSTDQATSPLPAAFDLRYLEAATPVKQQLGGTCWTHGTMAAIESHLILSGYWKGSGRDGLPALSEYHLDWWNGFNKHCNTDLADPEKDPTGMSVHQGGDYRVASAYFSRGDGIVLLPSGHDVYRDGNWYQKPPPKTDAAYQRFYVRDIEWFTMGDDLQGIDVIKRRIMTEGALGTCYAAGRANLSSDFVHYQPISSRGDPNHAVAIIGWDDNKITKDADKKAPKPGAWLIKNSWGTRRVEEGYNWISYYDKHCCRNPEMGAVSFRNIEPMVYTDIYYHDYHGWRDTLKNVSKAFNAYTATGRQLLRAVSFYTTKQDVKYTFRVYSRFEKGQLQGELAAKSGHIPFTGFHTVNLDVPVLLTKDQKFYVAVELSDGGHAIDRTSQIPVLLEQDKAQPPPKPQTEPKKEQPGKRQFGKGAGQPGGPWVISKAGPGESFYHDGTTWKDLYTHKFETERFNQTANFCIKALAVSVEEPPFSRAATVIAGLSARNIGPANMGGRIVDLAVVESDPKTIYVAAATGGLWKTTDAGATWAPVFDQQETLCLGAVAVAPSNPQIVYVGTGEANPRNSVSWGNGVYRSGDGGKTWTNVGLRETSQIGRVVVHPKDPNVVYVAAMGRFWGPNKERGLYKTTNGGKTWTQSKFLDENTGFIDVTMDPSEPDTLYAAAYQVRRDGYAGGNPRDQYGPHAGLYKTTDGGKTWAKMTEGLPTNQYGRCGLAVYRKDPNIVYAVVQSEKTNVSVRGQNPGNDNDPNTGGIFRSTDKGATWLKVNNLCPRPFYYGQIRIDPNDDQRLYILGVSFHVSSDGGKTFPGGGTPGKGGAPGKGAGGGIHPDHHALWINPQDSNHLVLGNDGGLYVSKNKSRTWEAIRGMALGQFYAVGVDMRSPYRVYGGLQDNGSWGGPVATQSTEGITLADWRRVGSGDGFYCLVDPTDPNTVYVESQYGNIRRVSPSGGQGRAIRPRPGTGEPAYRFNWNSPMLLSPHNPKTIFYGGNHLFRSDNRGDKWEVISPDLTHGKPGPSSYSGHTITTMAESPLKAGVLYVGTDDGRLHVTRDGGKTWIDLSEKVPGVPTDRWITRVECGHFAEGTAYLTIDRHRNDDLKTYVFKTTDFGATWTSLRGNLPSDAPAHVIRESSKNKDLLFVGTENGLFTSLDGGKRWFHLKNGLPPAVPINDLVIHPRDRELVIATHGRSVYVMDVAPLEELTATVLKQDTHLCTVKPATAFKPVQPEQPSKSTAYKAPNPAYGAVIHYYLRSGSTEPVSVSISNDGSGKSIMTFPGAQQPGLHQLVWDLRGEGTNGGRVEPGEYVVTLKVGKQTLTQKLRVEAGGQAATQD